VASHQSIIDLPPDLHFAANLGTAPNDARLCIRPIPRAVACAPVPATGGIPVVRRDGPARPGLSGTSSPRRQHPPRHGCSFAPSAAQTTTLLLLCFQPTRSWLSASRCRIAGTEGGQSRVGGRDSSRSHARARPRSRWTWRGRVLARRAGAS
jgi:hypothetical protein